MGTILRIRDLAMRQGFSRTRATRQRALSTEYGHAALRPGVTREYQIDSSSKRPVPSVDSGLQRRRT
jgi:hypothetical protein